MILKILIYLSNLNRSTKLLYIVIIDTVLCFFSIWSTYSLRYEKIYFLWDIDYRLYLISLIFLPIFFFTKIYKSINKFNNRNILSSFFFCFFIYSILFGIVYLKLNIVVAPKSLIILHPVAFFFSIFIYRYFYSLLYQYHYNSKINSIIVCNTYRNFSTVNNFINSRNILLKFIFDSENENLNKYINNLKIYHVDYLIQKFKLITKGIDQVILFLEDADNTFFQEVIDKSFEQNIAIKLYSIEQKKFIYFNDNDDLTKYVFDKILIKSSFINLNKSLNFISKKSIIITGAGGSIGSEISKNILVLNPDRILLIDSSELNLFNIEKKLIEMITLKNLDCKIESHLLSINDDNINKIFASFKADILIHSAAYKHVFFSENNKNSFFVNNFLGTKKILDLCIKNKVKKFILISTDKAVHPKSYMGFTKRLAEVYCFVRSKELSETTINIIRFGNVLNSSGSVIPTFISQINNKNSVKIFDLNASRFFMSISQASKLVIKTIGLSEGSFNLYSLDMGEAKSIFDLAKKTINLAGYKYSFNDSKGPLENYIKIELTKLMDNEKFVEELFYDDKSVKLIDHKIYQAFNEFYDINNEINEIKKYLIK